MAEYEALINGLHIAVKLGIKQGDSRMVIDQVMKESNCHEPKMEAYGKEVRRLEEKFDNLELNHVLRKYNEVAVALRKMVSEWASIPSDAFTSDIHKSSIDYEEDDGASDAPAEPILGSKASIAPEPEVIDIEQEEPKLDDQPDWRITYL